MFIQVNIIWLIKLIYIIKYLRITDVRECISFNICEGSST